MTKMVGGILLFVVVVVLSYLLISMSAILHGQHTSDMYLIQLHIWHVCLVG